MSTSQPRGVGHALVIPLRGLALGSVILALTSLTALVIVVSVKGIDALNTVAIALAILAFVVQIIVFIVQAADASRQGERAQELHTRMMGVMVQIQERTQGTQQSVDKMNTRLLEAVLGKASGEGLDVGSPPQLDEEVGIAEVPAPNPPVQPRVREDMRRLANSLRDEWPAALPESAARELSREMDLWPDEGDADEIRRSLKGLKDSDLRDVFRLARDVKNSSQPGAIFGPGLSLDANSKLVARGLAEKVAGWNLFTLTRTGRLVGRMFTADGRPPEALREFAPLRDRLVREREQQLAAAKAARREG